MAQPLKIKNKLFLASSLYYRTSDSNFHIYIISAWAAADPVRVRVHPVALHEDDLPRGPPVLPSHPSQAPAPAPREEVPSGHRSHHCIE